MSFINSAETIAAILPGVESYSVQDGTTRVKFRIDLEGMAGAIAPGHLSTATASMKFSYGEMGESVAVLDGHGRALGSSLDISVRIDVRSVDASSTEVEWKVSVDAGMLLRLFGSQAVDAFSNRVIEETISNFRNALSA